MRRVDERAVADWSLILCSAYRGLQRMSPGLAFSGCVIFGVGQIVGKAASLTHTPTDNPDFTARTDPIL
eukprot:2224564-Pleurochrysis_carterae.AAC.4